MLYQNLIDGYKMRLGCQNYVCTSEIRGVIKNLPYKYSILPHKPDINGK